MVKHKNMLSALLAAAILLALLPGCASAPAASESSPAASESAQAIETPSPSPAAETPAASEAQPSEAAAADSPAQSEAESSTVERVSYDLPLYDESQSFTFWSIAQGGGESRLDFKFWNQLSEKTNVQVEFVEAGESVALEQYNLMVASGNLTDVIWEGDLIRDSSATSVYPGGYDKAIKDGVYMDLTDVIKNDCPNYYSLLQQYPSVMKDLTTDNGTLYCFSYILNAASAPNMGPFVRTDVLEKTGYDMPKTVEEWYTVWKAMIDDKLIQWAARPSQKGVLEVPIALAYGTTGGSAFLIDKAADQVFYDPTSDAYRQYMAFFAKCYEAGIVPQDFYSMEVNMDVIDKGTIASFSTMAQAIANQMNANYDYTPAPYPYLEASGAKGPLLETYSTNVSKFKWCTVSANTDKLDVITKWMDFLYSDEGIKDCNFGFDEGVSYEVTDGNYKLLDAMADRDEKRHTGIMDYTMKEGPSFFYWDNEYNIMSDKIKNIYNVWLDTSYDDAVNSTLPSVALSDEENETVSVKMTDIETYVQTESMLWMTCQKELNDDSWNTFVTTIEGMGIGDVTAAYQSAYERYLAR